MVSEVLDFDGHAAVRSACARIHNSSRVAICHISEVWRTGWPQAADAGLGIAAPLCLSASMISAGTGRIACLTGHFEIPFIRHRFERMLKLKLFEHS